MSSDKRAIRLSPGPPWDTTPLGAVKDQLHRGHNAGIAYRIEARSAGQAFLLKIAH